MTQTAEKSKWQLYKERHWGAPVPPHLKHGPATAAMKVYGCDCEVCLPSGRRYWQNTEGATGPAPYIERDKKMRTAKRGTPVPANVKHGVYAYRVYACRCPVCMAARQANDERRRWLWLWRARGTWTMRRDEEGNELDVICWPPATAGPDWRCPCDRRT